MGSFDEQSFESVLGGWILPLGRSDRPGSALLQERLIAEINRLLHLLDGPGDPADERWRQCVEAADGTVAWFEITGTNVCIGLRCSDRSDGERGYAFDEIVPSDWRNAWFTDV